MSEGPYSFETGVKKTFHTADYAVFGCTLAVSAAIGIFYAIKDRKKNTTEEYLLAGRDMHPIPVALSLCTSFISAITLLGTPAEIYVYSTMYVWVAVSTIVMAGGTAMIFIPTFYKLGVTSVFEYVEMRFGFVVRIIASFAYLILMVLYMAIILYAPSLALNTVTGLSLWGSVLSVSLVCIFYTTLGGMKAVLWADTIQTVIVFTGLITLLATGANKLGGLDNAWDIANKNGRIQFLEVDPDPRNRMTVWSTVIGLGLFWMSVFGVNQAQVQRAISVRSLTRSKIAIWLNVPGLGAIFVLTCLIGVVMYAFYAECDPIKFGLVSRPDQLFALYMMDVLGEQHGLPGLLVSCVFSGSLSSMSSGLNAISAVVLEDFIRPMCCKRLDSFRATMLSKGLVILFGLISLVFAFLIAQLGTMILALGYSLFGVLGGPLLGLFTLGMLFPWANKWGGGIGLLAGLGLSIWIGFGAVLTNVSTAVKSPTYIHNCNWNLSDYSTPAPSPTTGVENLTTDRQISTSVYDRHEGIQQLYTVAYSWYTTIAVLTVVVVGMIVSLITGKTDPKTLNPKLICPVFDVFLPCLPEKMRKPLRFGVRHKAEKAEYLHKPLAQASGDVELCVNEKQWGYDT